MPEEKVSATQGTCEVEDAPHMNHDGRGWLKVPHSKMNSCIMWRPAADAGPRQPQESSFMNWADERPDDPATAPDSAMRVAEQITQSGYLRTADIAALIREAGSERERELREALRELGRYELCAMSKL